MRRIILFISFLAASLVAFADDDVFKRPAVQMFVCDNAHVLSEHGQRNLTMKLQEFNRETSTQILIYTTNDLHGYEIADFGQRLGEGWGIGQKDFDNGIVIVYKPKMSGSKGEVTIQTGYGIEPLIPDITCKRIIDNEMIPYFRKGRVYEGLNRAVDVCISLTKGKFKAADYNPKKQIVHTRLVVLLVCGFIVLILTLIIIKVLNDHYTTGGRYGVLFRGGFSGWSGGPGGMGGMSSGGGFGGGGFGGGGASGSW